MKGVVHVAFVAIAVALLGLGRLAAEDVLLQAKAGKRMHGHANPRGLTLSVSVRPLVVMSGNDVRIECRVPLTQTARLIEWGLDCATFYRASQESPGRVLYETLLQIPLRACGPCHAFCRIEQHDRLGDVNAAPAPLAVTGGLGCPDEPDGALR